MSNHKDATNTTCLNERHEYILHIFEIIIKDNEF